mmetsp:Transcript_14629/g.31817  ORF Transcript_14629/g.31817 Transcript_14629/m.31817 type:complete len:143 (+) Transcript_14629:108-536(+)|eukprot:CAMPEP_0172313736 /NCGR_PEP_ID=MMETSP1058-20130122/20847_1 /TAXON_ID=83371 /ORGANISM="Detonula confervacea, Strain CCMP 353" /LENGTH=142 /DNA_ID=CAMNT_0013027439 /DNA_START=77 /DNA_END=505 /DNA_ORIENTATION=-
MSDSRSLPCCTYSTRILTLYSTKRNMFYAESDRKSATKNTLREAMRIKKKLLSSPNTSNASLKGHLEMCGIPNEEIVGIERLVLEDPMRTREKRRAHCKVVLMEQEHQKISGDNDGSSLARLSIILTKRSASQARRHAAMAA